MPMGLNAAKAKLQLDLQNALKDAFKATFILGPGDEGENIANRFAQKGAGPMADAILNFVSQAQVVGNHSMLAGIIAPPMTGGPCSGALPFTGTELSLV